MGLKCSMLIQETEDSRNNVKEKEKQELGSGVTR